MSAIRFPESLWHGTSRHLLPSIKAHGLGSVDPLDDLDAIRFLAEANELMDFDEYNFEDPDHISKSIVRKAARQCSHGMNFQHGATYLTGSRQKAESYARRAPELIFIVKDLIRFTPTERHETLQRLLARFPALSGFLDLPSQPVLLEIPECEVSKLATEHGENLKAYGSLLDSHAARQQLAYRLLAPIPWSDLIIHDLCVVPDALLTRG